MSVHSYTFRTKMFRLKREDDLVNLCYGNVTDTPREHTL